MSDRPDILIIGGGPAGLMAAEAALAGGATVLLCEAKPSLARKFLMAGKSGLNLAKMTGAKPEFQDFTPSKPLRRILTAFGAAQIQEWAEGLGQATYVGSSGRLYPHVMKGSPLLRAWIMRLREQGLQIRTGWRWTGGMGPEWTFATPDGVHGVRPKRTILALGGASWPRLGSDGVWDELLKTITPIVPFSPANMGFDMGWSAKMAEHAGAWLKNVTLRTDNEYSVPERGEFVITKTGIEGSLVYAASRDIEVARQLGQGILIDLVPDLEADAVNARLSRHRGKSTLGNHLRKTLNLSSVARALLFEATPARDIATLAYMVKALSFMPCAPRPLAEAISSNGGVAWSGLTPDLALKSRPDIYVAGEMIDWSAPTGGFLLTGCFATGRWAGQAATASLSV